MVIKINKHIYTNVKRFNIQNMDNKTVVTLFYNGFPHVMSFFNKKPTIEVF